MGVILKTLLLPLLLALCLPCWGQDTATELIQSKLIEAPDSVAEGKLVSILLPPDLPFKVEPPPGNKLSFIDEETGKRAYLILEAKAPGYTISIDFAIVHPTAEERKKARDEIAAGILSTMTADQIKAYVATQIDAKFADAASKDEVYQDSHFVKVGKGPDPPVPPNPPNPPDPPPSNFDSLTKAVAALAKDLPASERATVKAVYETTGKEPYTTIKERASVTSTALQTALGLNTYDDWYSFRFGLAQELTKLKASGVLTESNHAQCWKAIAEGLK